MYINPPNKNILILSVIGPVLEFNNVFKLNSSREEIEICKYAGTMINKDNNKLIIVDSPKEKIAFFRNFLSSWYTNK